MDPSAIGPRIARVRTQAGLSTEELAARIGESPSRLQRVERGEAPASMDVVRAIARALHVHPFSMLETTAGLGGGDDLGEAGGGPRAGYLGRLLVRTRTRARLSVDEAACALQIPAHRLEAFERDGEVPGPEILARMAILYPVDERELTGVARLQAENPALAARMSAMDALLEVFLHCVRARPQLFPDEAQRRAVTHDLEAALSLDARGTMGTEREAAYFSIGHLSDRLLRALQDPEFHARVEALAREHAQAKAPGNDPDDAGAQAPAPGPDAES